MTLWLHWILLGLVAGTLGKFLVPGRDPPGCLITVALGILGAVVGGWIGVLLGWGRVSHPSFDVRSVALATAGAIVVLVAGRLIARASRRRRERSASRGGDSTPPGIG
ncbi:MAG TPA: GlsB/YeaQ/YmgE family stress response membrane protein [Gemmatimonadaceae bacterium]|nr:GlsB/YeaQ/YmgE family stress response membrane protein [Gemmatimonadaceae bacterium]